MAQLAERLLQTQVQIQPSAIFLRREYDRKHENKEKEAEYVVLKT